MDTAYTNRKAFLRNSRGLGDCAEWVSLNMSGSFIKVGLETEDGFMKKNGKAAIIHSFKKILSQKTMDKITVKEICEHSNVNRQTFYNHFEDILDVFITVFREEVSAEIAQNRTVGTWQSGFLATMGYLKKNAKQIFHVYHSSYWPQIHLYVSDFSKALLDGVIEECVVSMDVELAHRDRNFIIQFYRYLFEGFIIDWIKEGMEEEPNLLLERLLIMITGSIPRSIESFQKASLKPNHHWNESVT